MTKNITVDDLPPQYLLLQATFADISSGRGDSKKYSKIETKGHSHSGEVNYARNMVDVFSKIPSMVFHCDDCVLNAVINKDGATSFSFAVKENPEDRQIAQDIIDEIHDEFCALAESGLVENFSKSKGADIFHAPNPDVLFDVMIELHSYIRSFNKHMAMVLLSSASSILETYRNEESETSLSSPIQQNAIVKALQSIISTFNGADDFKVKANESTDPETSKKLYLFEITLGKNTPVSFEKRFATLQEVFNMFDAADETLDNNSYIALWPCQTGFTIETQSLKSLYNLIDFLYRETDLIEMAKDNNARLYIGPSQLKTVLDEPIKALRTRAYQH